MLDVINYNHTIIIEKRKNCIGLTGPMINWFKTYLFDKTILLCLAITNPLPTLAFWFTSRIQPGSPAFLPPHFSFRVYY